MRSAPNDEEDEECPICCNNFPAFNYYGCCSKPICTECYVHLISSTRELEVPCPYCKCAKNSIKARIYILFTILFCRLRVSSSFSTQLAATNCCELHLSASSVHGVS